MSEPEHLGQLVNALLSIGTALVLLGIVALLFPGRPVLRVLALGAYVTVPVALKSNAMFHPQPLAMFLATLAVFLTTRLVQRGSYGWWLTIALGVVVGAGQLVRSAGLWAFGVAVLALLGAAIARPDTRRRAIRSLVVVFGVGLLVPLPWYLYLNSNYGNPIFGRSSNAIAPTQSVLPGRPQIQPASIVPPIALARPLSYYLGSGLPETITDPHRGVLEPQFLPILYAETWGDYFGIWSWGAGTPRPEMSPSLNRRLVVQSVVGIVPTFVAIAGFLALLALALSRMCEKAELLAVALMPLAAFAAVAYYASKYVSPDGDTIKALFILPAIPCLAICLGFLGDAIFARWRVAGWVLIGLLTLSGLVSLTFGIA